MSALSHQQHDHTHTQSRAAVVPTTLRLGVDLDHSGRGVTIAFIDSGFYPHPDLTQPHNRIVAYKDIADPLVSEMDTSPDSWDWHGTMTSVTAAGNGYLSDGIYKGLASEAQLVLVKVSDQGRITEPNIERGLRWVIENKDRYNIRVVSVSLGGDEDISYQQNAVDQAAEDAVKVGLVVVVAAGNSGCTEHHKTVPPANAPSVITVGGYDDKNQIDGEIDLYGSSYGLTADGFVKPEVIAPAMWVAAPILPGTEAYDRAEALSRIGAMPDYMLPSLEKRASKNKQAGLWEQAGLSDSLRLAGTDAVRSEVNRLLEENKIVATHYQHADGTSFAAPIVASLVARLIEANPNLTPAAVKHILISTADRVAGAPAIRQGYGVVNASRALEEAKREWHSGDKLFFCPPRVIDGHIEFSLHDDSASNVSLAGDFNGWTIDHPPFIKDSSGVWRARIDVPASGRYQYKLVIDGSRWIEDPSNLMKEPDNYGGFNSVLVVS
jgi:serine protease AprX